MKVQTNFLTRWSAAKYSDDWNLLDGTPSQLAIGDIICRSGLGEVMIDADEKQAEDWYWALLLPGWGDTCYSERAVPPSCDLQASWGCRTVTTIV